MTTLTDWPASQPGTCPTCGGSGYSLCTTCGGAGDFEQEEWVTTWDGTEELVHTSIPCHICGGSGQCICGTCGGTGQIS